MRLVNDVLLDNAISSIANHIRSRTGKTDLMVFPEGFNDEIDDIGSILVIKAGARVEGTTLIIDEVGE